MACFDEAFLVLDTTTDDDDDHGRRLLTNGHDREEEDWARAKTVLEKNPNLMTPKVLLLALHNKPPLSVIDYMLKLNPLAAGIPKDGPTALQTAVEFGASIDVVTRILKACPFALVATASDEYPDDPLSLARKHRPQETELRKILSRPLGYWIEEGRKASGRPKPPSRIHHSNKVGTSGKKLHPSSDKQELDNIKVIAATIVRGQKRQMEALQNHREEVEARLRQLQNKQKEQDASARDDEALLREMDDRQRKHFKTQLVALDMKERAMKAKAKKMEKRIMAALKKSKVENAEYNKEVEKMEGKVKNVTKRMNAFQVEAKAKIKQLEVRLEQECKVNNFFRTDARLQLDQAVSSRLDLQEARVVAHHDFHDAPFVFASHSSNYVTDPRTSPEDEAERPLFPKIQRLSNTTSPPSAASRRHRSGSGRNNNKLALFRRGVRKNQ